MRSRPKRLLPLIWVVITLACLSAAAIISSPTRIHATGLIKTVGVHAYWDPEATQICSSIDWGTLSPGENRTIRIYVKSLCSVDATLTLATEAWDPAAAQNFLKLAWNYAGDTLKPGEIRPVDLTLSVSPEITGVTAFRFDIILAAQA